jgi:hypothetical protein
MTSVAGALAGRTVQATPYQFAKVADNKGIFKDLDFPTINNGGEVAFRGTLANGDYAIYKGNAANLTEVARVGQAVDGGLLEGLGVFAIINDPGTVAFTSFRAAPNFAGITGLFARDGAGIHRIAPADPAQFFASFGYWLNNSEDISFNALAPSYTDLYLGHSSATPAAQLLLVGGSINSSIDAPVINDGGTIAFEAAHTSGNYIYVRDPAGGLTILASNPNPPSGSGGSNYLSYPDINNPGTVIFSMKQWDGGFGLYKSQNGALQQLLSADNTLFARTDGSPAINNLGDIAFYAGLDSGARGIFDGIDPVSNKVILAGDQLSGLTVSDVVFYRGLNDAGQIAFGVTFTDGSKGIYIATPVPEPSSAMLIVAALPLLFAMRRNRKVPLICQFAARFAQSPPCASSTSSATSRFHSRS